MRRTQHAPRLITLLIAVVLVVVGVLGTFAGFPAIPETVAIWSYVAASALLLLGVFLPFI